MGDFGQPYLITKTANWVCYCVLRDFGVHLLGHFLDISVIFAASVLFVNGAPVEARVPFWRFWGVRRAWFWASGVDAQTEPTEGAILDSDLARCVLGLLGSFWGFITIWHGGALILLE